MNDSLFHDKAVAAWRKSEKSRWTTACYSTRIVGRKTDATRRFATELAVSVDTIEQLAHAWLGYLLSVTSYRKSSGLPTPGRIRANLSTKHYALLYRAWTTYEFDPADFLELLHMAAVAGMSAEALYSLVLGRENPGVDEWNLRLRRLAKQLHKLATDYGVPEELRSLTMEYLKQIQEYVPGE
jgi:hypothetical protein